MVEMISFEHSEAKICKGCKKGFLGGLYDFCPHCGNKLVDIGDDK